MKKEKKTFLILLLLKDEIRLKITLQNYVFNEILWKVIVHSLTKTFRSALSNSFINSWPQEIYFRTL